MSKNEFGKVWIVGAEGMVGTSFSNLIDRTKVKLLKSDLDIDITNQEDVMVYAEMNRPDVIVNCAGLTQLKACEEDREQAYKINAVGARNLSVAARRINAKMVQMSTDDVFSGTAEHPYCEFDETKPISLYGKSKLAGEKFVTELAPKHLIIRSSWVYGEGNSNSFVNETIKKAMANEEIMVAQNQIAAPTSALEVAKVIVRLLEADAYGVYHACCTGSCNRHELALKIVELLGSKSVVSKAESSEKMEVLLRPSYSILDDMMLRINKIQVPVSWEEALVAYLEQENLLEKQN